MRSQKIRHLRNLRGKPVPPRLQIGESFRKNGFAHGPLFYFCYFCYF